MIFDDERHDLERFFSSKVPDNATHIVIHMRNSDDIQALIIENNKLRDELKKARCDILGWSNVASKYHDCLDELREVSRFLRSHGLVYRFRNI